MRTDHESSRAFKVRGRVQGVGFRWWAQHLARSLGLKGTVCNCADGPVEITFRGAAEAVTEMSARLEFGPGAAHVAGLEELEPPDEFPSDFCITF